MRKWIKYFVHDQGRETVHASMDSNFQEHAIGMGGYGDDSAYGDKKSFFRRFYFGFQQGRLENYDVFLRAHLKKSGRHLSLASGRSANELRLIDEGYQIVCSDLSIPPCFESARKIFPNHDFMQMDILDCKDEPESRYDSIIVLSLIFLFDDEQLKKFFANCSRLLKPGGTLLLDVPGSPDNALSYALNDLWLRLEIRIVLLLMRIKHLGSGRKFGIGIKEHGFRRSDHEILSMAESQGFRLATRENYAHAHEFARSFFCGCAMKLKVFRRFFKWLGRSIPYTRMVLLEKLNCFWASSWFMDMEACLLAL